MKKYPLKNWKELSNDQKKEFDRIEQIVQGYLNMNFDYTNEVQAYNIAFLIVENKV